jgi:carbamoyltransferase
MKILGINLSHNFSICIYENGKILDVFFEERFILKKNFIIQNEDFLLSIFCKINFKPDFVIYSSYGRNFYPDEIPNEKIIKNIQKQLDNPPYFHNDKNHHIYHACSAFYFSKFNEAMAIIIDGGGAETTFKNYQEIQSIFYINKEKIFKLFQFLSNLRTIKLPKNFNLLENSYSNFITIESVNGTEYHLSSKLAGGCWFNVACSNTQMPQEPGKIMGLASYAHTNLKYNLNYEHVKIAKYVQEITFNETCDLIEKAYGYKKIKNFVLSGGYFLNCSNNFKYVKKYPNLNFFVDPNPSDGGTSIGACVYYDKYK